MTQQYHCQEFTSKNWKQVFKWKFACKLYSSSIPNSQKVEPTQMSTNWWKDKQNMICLYNGILFSCKKRCGANTRYKVKLPKMLSRRSLTQKATYHMNLFVWHIQNRHIFGDTRQISGSQRLGRVGKGGWLLNGYGISSWYDKTWNYYIRGQNWGRSEHWWTVPSRQLILTHETRGSLILSCYAHWFLPPAPHTLSFPVLNLPSYFKPVGCLLYMWYMEQSVVAQSCPTLCGPIDCSLPGFSVHGIFEAIVLEWIAISFSRGSSQPRAWTRVSCIVDRRFTVWATREVLE